MTADDILIFSYPRSEALEDGVLIDVTETAREAGFRVPVAMTPAAWAACVEIPAGVTCQDEAGRLWDVLTMLRYAGRGRAGEGSTVFFDGLAARGVRHSVVLGTCLEYAPQSAPLRENISPPDFSTPYARAKHALREALAQRGFDPGWARLFYPYGPGENARRLASSILRSTMKKEDIILKTPDSTKDYIFVDDVADALVLALEKNLRGIFNVGTGVGVKVREIAAAIAQILGEPARIVVPEIVADPYAHIVADPAKLHALGWLPRTSLVEGLTRLARSFTA